MNSMGICGRMAVLPGPMISTRRVGIKSPFLDQGHLKFYSRPHGSIRSSIGHFELKTVDDDSVQEVIRQLEELQMKVKAKKKELKSKKKEMKLKKCKESSSSSSESSDDDCTTKMTSRTATLNRVEFVENSVACARIEVCGGGKCRKNGSPQVLEAFQRRIQGENPSVVASSCKCMGMCGDGPNVRVKKSLGSSVHNHVRVEDVDMLMFQLGSMMPTSKAF